METHKNANDAFTKPDEKDSATRRGTITRADSDDDDDDAADDNGVI